MNRTRKNSVNKFFNAYFTVLKIENIRCVQVIPILPSNIFTIRFSEVNTLKMLEGKIFLEYRD